MRVGTKLAISSSVVIASMLSTTVLVHMRFRQESRLYEELATERLPMISLAREVRLAPRIGVRELEACVLFGTDAESSARYCPERQNGLSEQEAALNRLLDPAHPISRADAARIRGFQAGIARLNALEEDALRLNRQHTPDASAQARELLQSAILPLHDQLAASFDAFLNEQEKALSDDLERLNQRNRSLLFTLWAATLAGGLFSAFVSYIVLRRVSGTVQRLSDRAMAIASGDLTGEPLMLGTADQMIELGAAMQQMQDSLACVIGTVAETAGSLTHSAALMRSASDQVHRRVDEQTQQTQQTATALQEMSASIAEVSRHTQSAVESARSAAQTAREGGAIVRNTLEAMHSIASAVSDTSSTISLLGEDSRRISQIVTVIDEIARKTNLLALNAAIEAARAGDQGRGFAVVAGEVRHLAESTARATSEISAMIEGVQSRTSTAVASMKAGNITVEQGVVTTSQAGEALERIIGMAERVERMITQIAIAAGQQAHAADQSSASLDSIHLLSNENLAELATTTAGIEELRRTAATLEHQVERFRLVPCPASNTPAPGSQLSVVRSQLVPSYQLTTDDSQSTTALRRFGS